MWTYDQQNFTEEEGFVEQSRTLAPPLKATASTVGMTGFEPATPSSRTKYATGLRYIPKIKFNNPIRVFP